MKVAPILVLLGLAGSGYVSNSLKSYTEAPVVPAGLDAHETNAGASVLGQFRTTATGWLWLRTDLYLHNGVEMRMLSDEELKAGRTGAGSKDVELGEILNDSKTVTLVPPKQHDFRGFFGDIERATQSYESMEQHDHNSPKDALPLFRLMTWVDPHFVPGWTTAATIVAQERTDDSFFKAVQLLEEGLEANPQSVVILNELGRFFSGKRKDHKTALSFLVRATSLNLDLKRLDETELEAYQNAFRWAALAFRETGQTARQQEMAVAGLAIFPEDAVLRRLIGEPPYFLSEKGQSEWMEKMVKDANPDATFDKHDHDHDHDGHADH